MLIYDLNHSTKFINSVFFDSDVCYMMLVFLKEIFFDFEKNKKTTLLRWFFIGNQWSINLRTRQM